MKTVAKAVEPADRQARFDHIQPLYLEALTLVERLHRRLLDVIKDEFDRRGRARHQCGAGAAALQYRRQGTDRRRAAHARLLSRLERLLQSEEARRDGLPRSSALARRPPSVRIKLTDKGREVRDDRRGALQEARPHGRAGRRHQCRRVRDAEQVAAAARALLDRPDPLSALRSTRGPERVQNKPRPQAGALLFCATATAGHKIANALCLASGYARAPCHCDRESIRLRSRCSVTTRVLVSRSQASVPGRRARISTGRNERAMAGPEPAALSARRWRRRCGRPVCRAALGRGPGRVARCADRAEPAAAISARASIPLPAPSRCRNRRCRRCRRRPCRPPNRRSAAYEAIVARGGWPKVPRDRQAAARRAPPERHSAAAAADGGRRSRRDSGADDVYDSYVEQAVRRFQARHGLTVDGIVREQTFNAINVPAAVRLNQLKVNLIRLRAMCECRCRPLRRVQHPGGAHRGDRGRCRACRVTRAVVGKPDRPSPDINSRIVEINFNPVSGPCRYRSCARISSRRCRPSRTI